MCTQYTQSYIICTTESDRLWCSGVLRPDHSGRRFVCMAPDTLKASLQVKIPQVLLYLMMVFAMFVGIFTVLWRNSFPFSFSLHHCPPLIWLTLSLGTLFARSARILFGVVVVVSKCARKWLAAVMRLVSLSMGRTCVCVLTGGSVQGPLLPGMASSRATSCVVILVWCFRLAVILVW